MKKQLYTRNSEINAPADVVYDWHSRPGAIQRLSPPWSPIRLISKTPGVDTGTRVHMKIKTGPVFSTWKAEHDDCIPGRFFSDIQKQDPFRY